jgi:predicted  nucleic acid-binding Zn-ribbon protein
MSNTVKSTILALVSLQTIDDDIRVFQLQRDELTSNLERLRTIVEQMGGALEDKQGKLAESSGFYKQKQGELQADGDRLNQAKTKLGTVTRTKEYAAMQRELDNLRKKYGADETELKRLMEAMEEYQVAIGQEDTKLTELKAEVSREETTCSDQLAELDSKISTFSVQKKDLLPKLEQGLVNRYNRLLRRREGKAVVPVGPMGKCSGCQMRVPPQMYIQIQRAENLLSCPNCQRYLFMEEYPEANFQLEVNVSDD